MGCVSYCPLIAVASIYSVNKHKIFTQLHCKQYSPFKIMITKYNTMQFLKILKIANILLGCQSEVSVKQKFPHHSGTTTTIAKRNNLLYSVFVPASKCVSVNTTITIQISLSPICYVRRFLDEKHFNFCISLAWLMLF